MTEKYEYNDFEYELNYNAETLDVKIKHEKKTPEYVFKFYAINEYSIDALFHSYLYASHPFELNDILDSSNFLLYTSRPLDLVFYQKLFENILSNNEIEEIWQNDSNVDNKCRNYLLHMYAISFNLIGVISLTAKENNILMWPHYTQEKGFQIKFKTKKLIDSISNQIENENGEFLGFNPVNYCEKLNPIDVSTFNTLMIPISYATNVKSNKWAYEEEWRILVSKGNMGVPHSKLGLNIIPDNIGVPDRRKTKYNFEDIEEICLGMNFITAKDFNIIKLTNSEFTVQPNNVNNDHNYRKLLDFIAENLSTKLYYSGVKYELDEDDKLFVIRTKEKLNIEKTDVDIYKFTKTNQIIRLFD